MEINATRRREGYASRRVLCDEVLEQDRHGVRNLLLENGGRERELARCLLSEERGERRRIGRTEKTPVEVDKSSLTVVRVIREQHCNGRAHRNRRLGKREVSEGYRGSILRRDSERAEILDGLVESRLVELHSISQ